MKQRPTSRTSSMRVPGLWEFKPRRLENGYDCHNQAGVLDGRYATCYAAIASMRMGCRCYGCSHGDEVPGIDAQIVERRRANSHGLIRHPGGIRRRA